MEPATPMLPSFVNYHLGKGEGQPAKFKSSDAFSQSILEKALTTIQEAQVVYDQIMNHYTRRYQALHSDKKSKWTLEQYIERKTGFKPSRLNSVIETLLSSAILEGGKLCTLAGKQFLVFNRSNKVQIIRYDKSRPLGNGIYGEVFKMPLLNKAESVAVKLARLKLFPNAKEQIKKTLKNEMMKLIELTEGKPIWGLQFPPYALLDIQEQPNVEIYALACKKYLKTNYFDLLEEKEADKTPLRVKLLEFHQLLSALNYLATKDVIHQDIKPENVFLTHHWAHLADLGGARSRKEIAENPQERSAFSGIYAPFQELHAVNNIKKKLCSLEPNSEEYNSEIDLILKMEKSRDVYALGVVFFNRLTNLNPYPLTTHVSGFQFPIMTHPVSVHVLDDMDLPRALSIIILSMLYPLAAYRPKADEALMELENFIKEYDFHLFNKIKQAEDLYNSNLIEESYRIIEEIKNPQH